jgi:hypothetical protein
MFKKIGDASSLERDRERGREVPSEESYLI